MYAYGMKSDKMPDQYYCKAKSATGAYNGLIIMQDKLEQKAADAYDMEYIGQVSDLQYWRDDT